jgi:hypothetical protein
MLDMSNDRWTPAHADDGRPTGMFASESPPEVRTGPDVTSATYALQIEPKNIAIRGPRLPRATVRVEKEGGRGWQVEPAAQSTMPGGLVAVRLEVAQRERWEVLRDLEP